MEMKRKRILYFSKVDKGGSLIILDADRVEMDILDTLSNANKFVKLKKDPRFDIKNEIVDIIRKFVNKGIIDQTDMLFLTGKTEKEQINNHCFWVGEPYMYPLYKIHKLTPGEISEKVVPPSRMVTASVGGPTYRIGIWLEYILKTVANKYCEGELVRDTPDFLGKILQNNFEDLSKKKLVAMDICALYPSIKIEIALEAIESALKKVSNYTDTIINGIIELVKYSLKNSVLKFKETWYKSIEGVPTGGPESPQVANILVKYVIDEKTLQHLNLEEYNFLSNRSRFLDDIWGIWDSTETMFSEFLAKVNEIGSLYGITFTGECGISVVFLDVRTSIE